MYKILIVDEEPDMLSIARLFLERDGTIIVDTSMSPVGALAKMEVTPYDVIVSDYQMPEMDGLSFLREVRLRYGDIPFIMMTAYSREEVAIEALNNGATGYLQKRTDVDSFFTELTHLIRNAAGKRDAEQALAESEVRYYDIVENAHDLIHSIRPDGSFILVNRAWREALGYSAAEAAAMTVFDVIAPEALDGYMEMFSALLRGTDCEGFETVFLSKDGRRIPVRGNISCWMAGGIPVASRGIFYDISRVEKDTSEMHTVLASIRNLPLPFIFTDRNGMIIRTNSLACSLFQKTVPSLSGMDVRLLFIDPASWDQITSAISENGAWQGEALMQTTDDDDGSVHSLCCAAAYGCDGVSGVYSMAFPGYPLPGDCNFDVK